MNKVGEQFVSVLCTWIMFTRLVINLKVLLKARAFLRVLIWIRAARNGPKHTENNV